MPSALTKTITETPPPPAFALEKAPKPSAKSFTSSNVVNGSQNVKGNTVDGNHNVLGGQVCPNGICIGGDNYGNPTVNNFAPPSRSISPELRTAFLAQLSKRTANVDVEAVEYDKEANDFAQELDELLGAAGWQPGGMIIPIVEQGARWKGVTVVYHGEPPPNDQLVSVPDNTPQGNLVHALIVAKVKRIAVQPNPNLPAGAIRLVVSSNPEK
jgi:hypothetical protein